MNLIFVSAEVAPYSKAGGLADVAGSLPGALSPIMDTTQVLTPLYGQIDLDKYGIQPTSISGEVVLGDDTIPYTLFQIIDPDTELRVGFIECEQFFGRDGIYTEDNGEGFSDNNRRYFFFQLAVFDLLSRGEFKTDVLHCNDHHTGLLPLMVKHSSLTLKTIYTIHNFLYHGHFSDHDCALLPPSILDSLSITQWDNYSALLEGIEHSDIVTTVSPGYARELIEGINVDAHSHKVIIKALPKLSGIVNGIDTEYWSPEKDGFTPHHFSHNDISGKLKNKVELLKQCGLDNDPDMPLIGSISRLVENKGFPLIVELLDDFVALGAKFVFLGSGDPRIAKQLKAARDKHPGKIAFDDGFNEPLAHLIEAGCDMFLMPSRFEPCGLNQLYSLRYGTIPIVHKTGGLGDTVLPWKSDSGTGFVFDTYDSDSLRIILEKALKVYGNKIDWQRLMTRAMLQDFSWDRSAEQYFELYKN